jgi:hypothetical protein
LRNPAFKRLPSKRLGAMLRAPGARLRAGGTYKETRKRRQPAPFSDIAQHRAIG